MKTTASRPTEAGISKSRVQTHVLFGATCPKCCQQVLQHGFSRVLLFAYLDADHPIEAYCAMCDELWPISAEERRAIIGALQPGPV